MILQWLFLIFFSVLPLIELRLSIPVGILSGSVPLFFGMTAHGLALNPIAVFVVASLTNILLGFAIFNLLSYFDKHLRKSDINYAYTTFLDHAREKLSPFVKKFGILGVVIFIMLPIPGSGVYVGSVGAYVLGVSKSAFRKACVLGVLLASSLITILTLTGEHIFG